MHALVAYLQGEQYGPRKDSRRTSRRWQRRVAPVIAGELRIVTDQDRVARSGALPGRAACCEPWFSACRGLSFEMVSQKCAPTGYPSLAPHRDVSRRGRCTALDECGHETVRRK